MPVRILYRILPEEAGEEVVDRILGEIERRAGEAGFKVLDHRKEPVAFGLNALLLLLEVEEAGGVLERVEEELRSIEGVSSVEAVRLTRI